MPQTEYTHDHTSQVFALYQERFGVLTTKGLPQEEVAMRLASMNEFLKYCRIIGWADHTNDWDPHFEIELHDGTEYDFVFLFEMVDAIGNRWAPNDDFDLTAPRFLALDDEDAHNLDAGQDLPARIKITDIKRIALCK